MTPPYPEDLNDPSEDEPWEQSPSSSLHGPPADFNPTWVRRTRGLVLKTWNPQPLTLPRVDGELAFFGAVARSAEVLRYTVHKTEYWLSPGGWLREWVRLNVRIAFLLAIPSLLVAPLITCALGQLSAWITLLTATTTALVLFPLSALLVVGLVCGLVFLSRSFHLPRPRRQSQYYD